MKIINLLTLSLCIYLVSAFDPADWVDSHLLPLNFSSPPFYAGYLQLTQDIKYFYVYHQSLSNPSKDPLVVRISSGGCSSLYSWLYYQGPFVFKQYDKQIVVNPFQWNKQANVLFIQGPGGVGFSMDSSSIKKKITDEQYANSIISALYKFYQKFPQQKDQDLYLTGQRHGGVTIPIVAKKIIQINNDPYQPTWLKFRLRGFLLENPCTMQDQCPIGWRYSDYTVQYLRNHYFISRQKYSEYIDKCSVNQTGEQCMTEKKGIENDFIATNSDITNIYRPCINGTIPQRYPCIDNLGILLFLNDLDVIHNLHVDMGVLKWDLCNSTIIDSWVREQQGSLHIYQQLLRQQRDLRIWIVSGTLNGEVPTIGTRRWVESLKNTLGRPTTRVWDAWKYDNNINAGSIEQFRGMTFISIRAAGLRMYRDQPEIGNYIYQSFIKGRRL